MEQRILVVSNEAFSDSSSNGRTLKNLLLGIPVESIAQFYLHGTPDTDFCHRYFQVSDHDALRAFLGKTPVKIIPEKNQQAVDASVKSFDSNRSSLPIAETVFNTSAQASEEKPSVSKEQKISIPSPVQPVKSYRNRVIRNVVWQSYRWWKQDFSQFLQTFQPTVVLLQAGDAPFMYAIARRIAKRYGARLMMYNSESYVLKKQMYASRKPSKFWHFWLMSSLKKQYRKFMKKADYCVYSTEALEAAYQSKYPHPGKSTALYTVSTMQQLSPTPADDRFHILYCGNLGVGRAPVLNEIADILKELDPTIVLDIYGKFPSDSVCAAICRNENVHYGGVVPYSQVPTLMSKASLLLHCEHPDRLENLRYAFSTKIADCLASGIPFLVYAPREYPFVVYLEKASAAHVAANKGELIQVVKQCKEDEQYRNQHIPNALTLAADNHSVKSVSANMKQIMTDIL